MPARLRRWTSSAVPLLPKVRGSASSGPPTLLFDGMPTRLEADRVGLVCGVRSGLRGDRRDAPLLFAPMREEARQARPASSAARRRYWRACRVSSDRRAGSLDLPALLPPRGSLRAMAGRRRRSARPRAGSRPRRDPRSGERAARSPSVQQLERDRRGRDASARELTPATVEAMPRRSPRQDRKAGHGSPGRNLSARARGEREQRRRSEAEAEEQDRLEQRRRRAPDPKRPPVTVCPRGKSGYPEHVARAKLAEYAESSRPNRPVRVYLCPHCSAWHLTSSPDRPDRVAPPASFDPSRPAIPPPSPRLRPPRPSSSGSS